MPSPLIDKLTAALGPGFTVERELTGGGMSRVFVVMDAALERRVAVKVLPDHLAASVSVDRFKREILTSAGLQHPHIVGVLSAGEANGLPYFVMPFIDGESLGTRLSLHGRMTVRETVSILTDVSRALAYAHERGIIHRDIKPHNILLSAGAATVTDFGVAKALSSARRSGGDVNAGPLTGTGMSLGTPLYMAPEQAAADPDVDHRADIYALGITAYEMLTGAPPFAGMAPRAMLAARMTQDPPRVTAERPDVPAALDALVMRCLAREPADRPQSAIELLQLLDDADLASGAHDSRARGRDARRAGLLRRGMVAAALATVAVAGALVRFRDAAMPAAGAPASPLAATAPSAPAPGSLVVLPLANIGADPANNFLAEAMTNELAAGLGRVRGMHVVSPSRAQAMLASGKSSIDVGRSLNVALQLEGTVQREGNRLRVTARLVDVRDGMMRWSDLYESEARDVMTAQKELSRIITEAVGSELQGAGDVSAASGPPRTSVGQARSVPLL